MTNKLCILLLGLAALAAVIQADYPLKKLNKRQSFNDVSREDVIEFLKNLTPEDVEEMSDEEKLGLVFLIFHHRITDSDLQKRSLLGLQKRATLKNFATHSLTKRETDDDDLSREEFIQYLKNITPEEIDELTDEQKLGLVFLIYLFDIQAEDLEKREALTVFAKRSLVQSGLQKRQADDDPDADDNADDNADGDNADGDNADGDNADDNADDDNADDDDGFNRENFIAFLNELSEEDVQNMSKEEKLGILILIHLFEVQPEEVEKRSVPV